MSMRAAVGWFGMCDEHSWEAVGMQQTDPFLVLPVSDACLP